MSDMLFLTPKEVEKTLGVSTSTVYRRIKDGTIPTVPFGGMRLIPATFLKDLENRANAGAKS
jgi:excisionase family DNA binding protein